MTARMSMKTRVAITGAAGWLGRELLYRLNSCEDFELLPLGRRSEVLDLQGSKIPIYEWTDKLVREWNPSVVVHLAFITRERLDSFGEETFIEENLELRKRIVDLCSSGRVRHLIHASSGAAVTDGSHDLYGQLKRGDEESFKLLGDAMNFNVLTARAWSLTGRFCTKPSHFLFFNVLSQITNGVDEVVLTASGEVWRKYVDAGDFLESCVRISQQGATGTIDSTGDLVEAGDLVRRVAEISGRRVVIARPNWSPGFHASRYFSDSPYMDDAMNLVRLRRLDLDQQIRLGFSALS